MEVTNFIKVGLSNGYQNGDIMRFIQKLFREIHIDVNWDTKEDLFILNPQKSADINNAIVRQCNGLVMSKKTFEPVCMCFPFIRNVTELNEETKASIKNITEYRVEEMYDGTCIRLYYSNGRWNAATNKCYDAKKATWQGNASFNEMFEEALKAETTLEEFHSALDTKNTYFFTLLHPNNRIVIQYSSSRIIHIATFETLTGKELPLESIGREMTQQNQFETFDAFETALNENNVGFVLVNKTTGERTKVYSPKFMEIKNLRGNIQNVQFLLLERMYDNTIDKLMTHYPEYEPKLRHLETKLDSVAKGVYNMYLGMYIPGRHQTYQYVDKYQIACNDLHREFSKTKERVTLETVKNMLRTYTPALMGYLIGISPSYATEKPREQKSGYTQGYTQGYSQGYSPKTPKAQTFGQILARPKQQ